MWSNLGKFGKRNFIGHKLMTLGFVLLDVNNYSENQGSVELERTYCPLTHQKPRL